MSKSEVKCEVAVKLLKSLVAQVRCTNCNCVPWIPVTHACNHVVCYTCAENCSHCALCPPALRPGPSADSSPPVPNDVLAARVRHINSLLHKFENTFDTKVFAMDRTSKQFEREKQVFPHCIQARRTYSDRRSTPAALKSYSHISEGNLIPTSQERMSTSMAHVREWLEKSSTELYKHTAKRRPFADILPNAQNVGCKGKAGFVAPNPNISTGIENFSVANLSKKKSKHKKRSTRQVSKHCKTDSKTLHKTGSKMWNSPKKNIVEPPVPKTNVAGIVEFKDIEKIALQKPSPVSGDEIITIVSSQLSTQAEEVDKDYLACMAVLREHELHNAPNLNKLECSETVNFTNDVENAQILEQDKHFESDTQAQPSQTNTLIPRQSMSIVDMYTLDDGIGQDILCTQKQAFKSSLIKDSAKYKKINVPFIKKGMLRSHKRKNHQVNNKEVSYSIDSDKFIMYITVKQNKGNLRKISKFVQTDVTTKVHSHTLNCLKKDKNTTKKKSPEEAPVSDTYTEDLFTGEMGHIPIATEIGQQDEVQKVLEVIEDSLTPPRIEEESHETSGSYLVQALVHASMDEGASPNLIPGAISSREDMYLSGTDHTNVSIHSKVSAHSGSSVIECTPMEQVNNYSGEKGVLHTSNVMRCALGSCTSVLQAVPGSKPRACAKRRVAKRSCRNLSNNSSDKENVDPNAGRSGHKNKPKKKKW